MLIERTYMTDDCEKRLSDARSTRAYAIGRAAFYDGKSPNDNPYPQGAMTSNDRTRWYIGWYDQYYGTAHIVLGKMEREGK